MAEIKIDLKKLQNANYSIPSVLSGLAAQKRYLNLLKWRIPTEIQNKKQIRKQLDACIKEITEIEEQINDIYKVSRSAVMQYTNVEKKLNKNASQFK